MSLSHLLFVDDVLLFYFGDEYNLGKTLEFLDLFCAGIGMEVNYKKSSCYRYNINRTLYNGLDTFNPFDKYDLGDDFKYLGYFLKPNNYYK